MPHDNLRSTKFMILKSRAVESASTEQSPNPKPPLAPLQISLEGARPCLGTMAGFLGEEAEIGGMTAGIAETIEAIIAVITEEIGTLEEEEGKNIV